ncbi:MAG: ral substrate transporter [Firmicutes bacterium]|nr:ral substrate transporter [Bacillota bacterium]
MDITSRLEQIPVSSFHYKLLVMAGMGWMFDAMDTGIIAFVLPVLMAKWSLTAAQVGLLGSIGLLGMAVGAVLSGAAADRFGRKMVFSVTLLIYSVATGLCAAAGSFEVLVVLRFLVGFGLGGELPVAATLVTEYCPSAKRGWFMVLLESFWGVGWLVAALVAYLVIPHYGWQSAFIIGALPALYVFIIRLSAPESVRYLIGKGKVEQAHAIVSKIEQSAGLEPIAIASVMSQPEQAQPRLSQLWTGRFIRRTVMLWLLWFGIVYSYYGIFTWLPSLLVGQGYTVLKSFEFVLIMTIAQLPGYFSAAYLVDKLGRKPTLTIYLAMSAVCAYYFGQGGGATTVLVWGSLMAFFNLGAWGIVYTYTPEQYPTSIRASGTGWAAAIGRFGGMLAPIAVAYMLGGAEGFTKVFGMFTVVLLGIAVVVWLLGEETKGKALDVISE